MGEEEIAIWELAVCKERGHVKINIFVRDFGSDIDGFEEEKR